MAYPQQTKDQQNDPFQCQQFTPLAPEYAPICSPPAQPVYPVMGVRYPPPALGYGYAPSTGYYPPPTSGYLPVGATYGPPIINQPSTQGWMVLPEGLPACPPGLEDLSMIDELLVQQKEEVDSYIVKNNFGQKVYYASGDTGCLTWRCWGAATPFHLKILDNYDNEVINMHRPLACSTYCCPACPCSLESMEVSAPPGNIIGRIEEDCTFCTRRFFIKNANDEIVLRVEGPVCKMSICGDVEFTVLSADGKIKVGSICKQRSPLAVADFFGITFPMDLDVKMKAVMLGACLLIGIKCFEENEQAADRCLECLTTVIL